VLAGRGPITAVAVTGPIGVTTSAVRSVPSGLAEFGARTFAHLMRGPTAAGATRRWARYLPAAFDPATLEASRGIA